MDPIQTEYVYPHSKDLHVSVSVYPLTEEGIESIPADIVHGNYRIGVLGRLYKRFHVKYVGRADHGLKDRVSDHLTDDIKELIENNPGRVYFSYNSEIDELDSYHRECQDYHDFTPKLNKIHPRKPSHPYTLCRICGI